MAVVSIVMIALLAAAGTLALRCLMLVLDGGGVHAGLAIDLLGKYALSGESQVMLLAFAVAFAGEVVWMGWARSSLRRLLVGSPSRPHTDVVMSCLALFGFQAALVSLLTAGLWERAGQTLHATALQGPLAGAPTWIAAPLIYLAISFANYWTHRAWHTKFLWPLHAVHHAAPAFTVANAARVSIPELTLSSLTQAAAAALLGGSEAALYWAFLVANFETLWTHSNFRGVEWLERIGINSPKGHMIHHALDATYHDRNFGDLICLWDKLFGTYIPSTIVADELRLGVDDPNGVYMSGRPLRDWLLPQWRWFAGLATAGWVATFGYVRARRPT